MKKRTVKRGLGLDRGLDSLLNNITAGRQVDQTVDLAKSALQADDAKPSDACTATDNLSADAAIASDTADAGIADAGLADSDTAIRHNEDASADALLIDDSLLAGIMANLSHFETEQITNFWQNGLSHIDICEFIDDSIDGSLTK